MELPGLTTASSRWWADGLRLAVNVEGQLADSSVP